MVQSMTGFASGQGADGAFQWIWDIRSVNSKGLDVRMRVPDWITGLEADLKPMITKAINRGSVSLALRVTRDQATSAIAVSSIVLEATLKAMAEVVEGKNGTAQSIRNSNYRIAGKTGTAQVFGIKQDETYDKETLAKRLLDHALFIAFAPVERPRIAVAVIVENGESGGKVAAPISKTVMDAYLLGPEYDELDEGQPAQAPCMCR